MAQGGPLLLLPRLMCSGAIFADLSARMRHAVAAPDDGDLDSLP